MKSNRWLGLAALWLTIVMIGTGKPVFGYSSGKACGNHWNYLMGILLFYPERVTIASRTAWIRFYASGYGATPWRGFVVISIDGDPSTEFSASVKNANIFTVKLHNMPRGLHQIDISLNSSSNNTSPSRTYFSTCVAIPGDYSLTANTW